MKTLAILAIAASLIARGPSAPANYAGAWALDQARSTGLPDYYSRVKAHSLQITQTDTELKVDVAVDIGAPEPDRITLTYPLNGVEKVTESAIRGPGGQMMVPTKLTAAVREDGGVHITIARTIAMGGSPIEALTTEDWSLAADGKELRVHRVDDTPRGRIDAQMVFVKR